jgi:hypothetical protein
MQQEKQDKKSAKTCNGACVALTDNANIVAGMIISEKVMNSVHYFKAR